MPMPADVSATGEEVMPDPQLEKRQRRRFSAEQKHRILDEVDACTQRGEVGAILRREGLYASQLSTWRRQREQQGLAGLEPKVVSTGAATRAERKPGQTSSTTSRCSTTGVGDCILTWATRVQMRSRETAYWPMRLNGVSVVA